MAQNRQNGQGQVANGRGELSDDPRDVELMQERSKAQSANKTEKMSDGEPQQQPTREDFAERGMGIGAKE